MKDHLYFIDLNKTDILDKTYRYKQILESVFVNGKIDFKDISNIPRDLRERLRDVSEIVNLKEETREVSVDGTVKFLFRLHDGAFIESVFLVDINSNVTFCISTQVGCRMGCVFCRTGTMGLVRNLTSYEILSQIIYIYSYMFNECDIKDRLFNIVFMGMGEGLDNFDNLVDTIKLIVKKEHFGLSPSRITVSTCGLADMITRFSFIYPNVRIAVSLNSPIQEKRASIMPVSNKYPIDKLASVLKEIYQRTRNRITLEYVLIKDYNMSDEDIKALSIFNSDAFHINLIPLNHSDENVKRPEENDITSFMSKLEKKGFCVTRRYRRGADIKADCGQLCTEFKK